MFIFNGDDWAMPYLGMFRSVGTGLAYANRPALADDANGNILAVWPVLTADTKVEIWWNRLRVP